MICLRRVRNRFPQSLRVEGIHSLKWPSVDFERSPFRLVFGSSSLVVHFVDSETELVRRDFFFMINNIELSGLTLRVLWNREARLPPSSDLRLLIHGISGGMFHFLNGALLIWLSSKLAALMAQLIS